jgi:hypothetical protein
MYPTMIYIDPATNNRNLNIPTTEQFYSSVSPKKLLDRYEMTPGIIFEYD